MDTLLGDISAKVGKEGIFKLIIRNERLHEISNDNGVSVVSFATSKNLTVKVRCAHVITFINSLGHLLMERHTIKFAIFL
jgi:hypothetical protein